MSALGKMNLVMFLYLSAGFFGLSFYVMDTHVNVIFNIYEW